MKQHITPKQLNELSEASLMKLAIYSWGKGWCVLNPIKNMPNGDGTFTKMVEPARVPLLSIGQMIEFLDGNDHDFRIDFIGRDTETDPNKGDWGIFTEFDGDFRYIDSNKTKPELCDALWEAVKQILEQEQ